MPRVRRGILSSMRVVNSRVDPEVGLFAVVACSPEEYKGMVFGLVVRCGGLHWEVLRYTQQPGNVLHLVLKPVFTGGSEGLQPGMVLRYKDDPMPLDEYIATRGKFLQLALLARMIEAEGYLERMKQVGKDESPAMERLVTLVAVLRDQLPSPQELAVLEEMQRQMVAKAAILEG